MREIKFRAWDKYNKEMFELKNNPISELNIASLPIMQYTGLKDKNDKEIYEGDIVICPNWWVGVLRWKDDGGVGWSIEKIGDPTMTCNLNSNDEWKILGNIYENPELLEDKG